MHKSTLYVLITPTAYEGLIEDNEQPESTEEPAKLYTGDSIPPKELMNEYHPQPANFSRVHVSTDTDCNWQNKFFNATACLT